MFNKNRLSLKENFRYLSEKMLLEESRNSRRYRDITNIIK